MIAAWMLSAVLVGLLATAGAMAGEHVLSSFRRPSRFVWLAAMAVTLAWPALAYVRAHVFHDTHATSSAAPSQTRVQRMTAIVVHASERSLHVPTDLVLLVGWTLLSTALLARMFFTLRALRARARACRAEWVDGVQIRLSRDVGPAVVGLDPMEVILPEWTLDLERPLRTLVLAHEEEHRRARDPHLLMLTAALVVLVPWNVALWWQARHLRLAIELDCDARVLRAHPRPDRYSLLLLAIAQRRTTSLSLLAPALSEHTSNLERRINAMRPSPPKSRVRVAVLGVAAIVAIAVACSVDAPVDPAAHASAARTTSGFVSVNLNEVDSNFTGHGVTPSWADGRIIMATLASPGTRSREQVAKRMRAAMEHNAAAAESILKSVQRERARVVRGEGARLKGTDSALYEFQVARTATWIESSGSPRYPASLKAAHVDGQVQAQFSIDEQGQPDATTFRVLKSTNPQFSEAVRLWLSTARFTPAEAAGGVRVRQHVQQTFEFKTD